jgi:DNA-binding GntR family transcriptional regulator
MTKDAHSKAQDLSHDPKTKLSHQAYDHLLRRILNLDIQPGDILVEASVANELGTSRAPVREALKTLTTQGFLRVLPRTGYMVIPVTPEDVHEILHLRLLLEGEAASLAAERASDPQTNELLDELAVRLKELKQRYSKRPMTVLESYDENSDFHIGIARSAGSGRLATAIRRLLDEDRRVLLSNQRRVRTIPIDNIGARVLDDHLELLTVIRAGDPEKARTAMTEHIEQGRISIMQN